MGLDWAINLLQVQLRAQKTPKAIVSRKFPLRLSQLLCPLKVARARAKLLH